MAHFLIMTAPVTGHVNPVLPIAKFLVGEGHQICWITGRKYQKKVERTGSAFYPLPSEMDPGEMEPYDFYPELRKLKGLPQIKYYLKHFILDNSHHEIAAINEVLTSFPADVLIGDSITNGIYFKAEQSGIPSLFISLLPPAVPSKDVAPFGLGILPGKGKLTEFRNKFLDWLINEVLFADVSQYLNQIRKNLKLKPLKLAYMRAIFSLPTEICQLTVESFEYRRSDLARKFYFVGPVFPEADPDFVPPDWWKDLQTDKPVILVNQGTMATDVNDLIKPTIEALQNEDVLVIAVPVGPQVLPLLPANARVASYIPFALLLPHIDLMVTNGGYGGTQFALSYGIPLVVAGGKEDKMEVAARVEWSGAGINLRNHHPAPDKIRKAVRKVLADPKYRQNAQRLQADIARHHAPRQIAQLLEQMVKSVPA